MTIYEYLQEKIVAAKDCPQHQMVVPWHEVVAAIELLNSPEMTDEDDLSEDVEKIFS